MADGSSTRGGSKGKTLQKIVLNYGKQRTAIQQKARQATGSAKQSLIKEASALKQRFTQEYGREVQRISRTRGQRLRTFGDVLNRLGPIYRNTTDPRLRRVAEHYLRNIQAAARRGDDNNTLFDRSIYAR